MAAVRGGVLAVLFLLGVLVGTGNCRKNWVMLLSGAMGYRNYPLQSMVFHACHTVMNKGIPKSTIVHMNTNDVANDNFNPYKGNLVTQPNGTVNWWPGCDVDYQGAHVKVDLFLKVLSGDKDGVREILGREGRVIDSGPDDNIFVYMADHGGPGFFCFPWENLPNKKLVNVLKKMSQEKKFAKMMLYMEACYSGSMFEKLLPENIRVLSMTAANPHETASACGFDTVRKAFTSGFFDNAWEYDTDNHTISKETYREQYNEMVYGCSMNVSLTPSHPQQYGDKSFNKLVLKEFQGAAPGSESEFPEILSGPERSRYQPEEESISLPDHLRKEAQHVLPYSSKGRTVYYEDIDLLAPPLDILDIATPARQLLHETDPSQIRQLQGELVRLSNIRREAKEFFDTILIDTVGKDIASTLSPDHFPEIRDHECYFSAIELFGESCPSASPFRFPFVRRHFIRLIQMCNLVPLSEVAMAIEGRARISPVCWAE